MIENAARAGCRLSVDLHGAIALLSWRPPEAVQGRGVSHYEVERSAGPGQTMVREVKGTIYVDPQSGSGNLAYRVWAGNALGEGGLLAHRFLVDGFHPRIQSGAGSHPQGN